MTTHPTPSGRSWRPKALPTRQIAAIATAGALLALPACGRGADTGPDTKKQDISSGKATGTISVWAMGTEGAELGDFVKDFEAANPDADVKVTAIPWESAHDKISTAIASGDTPDVSLIGTTWMGEFAQADGLEPTPDGLVDSGDFYEGAWNSTEVDGTSYGVPWYVETRVLYYRTDLAAQAGWDKPPTSWSELSKFAGDLKSKADVGMPLYVQPGQTGSWQTALPFVWSAGGQMTNESGTDYTLDSAEMKTGLEYYKSLFDDGFSTTGTLDAGQLESDFTSGDIGSFISGPWEIGLVKDAGLDTSKFAVAPLPGQESGMGTSFIGGGDLAVFRDAKNRDGAWKFVQWLSQPDVQSKWYETMSDLPAVKSAWDNGALADDQMLGVFGEQLNNGEAPPTTPTWEQVAAVIDSDVEQVVKGKKDVSDAVSDMQSQAQTIGTGL
jgi:multiple sugar transport system substrate-binding protein